MRYKRISRTYRENTTSHLALKDSEIISHDKRDQHFTRVLEQKVMRNQSPELQRNQGIAIQIEEVMEIES